MEPVDRRSKSNMDKMKVPYSNTNPSPADKEMKDKANRISIQNLKKRKPHLYREGWLTEAYKSPNYKKMDKQISRHQEKNIRTGPDKSLFDPKYRNDSRNRAMKMSGIRDAMLRGEDPRQDTRGGAFKKRGNPDMDHRAGYTRNPMNNPKRRVKNPGVGEKGDQVGGRKRGMNRVYGTTRLIKSKDGQGYSGLTKPLGKRKDVHNEETLHEVSARHLIDSSRKAKKESESVRAKFEPGYLSKRRRQMNKFAAGAVKKVRTGKLT